ncbi:hypothetical protein ANN_26351 [Periplaneta americana]|uniref:Tc1-like transposase DDE domain-containing protein n=1 Tax=Periplaneta americana TaxID=6978 RepID=A0ABQ8S659_PERAM|nr:hypothetical protein ANN_26351 [Periplaneta americana]
MFVKYVQLDPQLCDLNANSNVSNVDKSPRGINASTSPQLSDVKGHHVIGSIDALHLLQTIFIFETIGLPVIFSDETTISSDYEDPVRVYRENGLRHDQRYVHRRERSGRFSISCWGWMSYDGPGVTERIDGRFNAGTYEHILENVFLLSVRERFPQGTLLFQQDNHPVHYAASIQRWFQRRPEIEIINWPPKSPDLNVIENLCAELKKIRTATYAHRRPRNRDELWNQVVDTWEDLVGDQNLVHNLVTSMPDRLRAVIEADGMWTRF